MWVRENLPIDEFLEIDFVGNADVIFLRPAAGHAVFIDTRQKPLFILGSTEGRRRETNQFHMLHLFLDEINDAPICFCRGVMGFIYDEENFFFSCKPRGKTRQIGLPANTVLAYDEQIVLRINVDRFIMIR